MNKKTKILVVDDENDFRKVMTLWLESKGYDVLSAPDGKTAIRMVRKDAPDIIFLDLNMPVMDGTQTVKEIRAFNEDIPIIIISAYPDRMLLADVKNYDISGVFYKEEDLETGLALLETTLRTHKKLK